MLGRTWGRRGEITASLLAGDADRFRALHEVWLFGAEGAPGEAHPLEIESAWEQHGRPVLKFRGVDSISDAERLRGAEVRIPLEQRAPREEGTFYESDLVGCEVLERRTGERLGVVSRLLEYGGPALLEVQGEGEPLLVPFARAICVDIDVERRRVVVELPEGLKELSRE